jgi:hypothetical protein
VAGAAGQTISAAPPSLKAATAATRDAPIAVSPGTLMAKEYTLISTKRDEATGYSENALGCFAGLAFAPAFVPAGAYPAPRS